jgi:3D (Asp-Asp-Asp) domain-containing protein
MRPLLLLSFVLPIQAPETHIYALEAQLAVHEVFTFGAVGSTPTERTIVESSWWWIHATVTGYSPHDTIDSGHASTQDTKTATMRDWRTHPYGLAADPKILPYGTYIQVPGYLEKSEPNTAWMVDDTGGNMRKSWRRGIIHIDVRFRTESSARKFGKKDISVLVDISEMTPAQKKKLLPYKVGEL